MTFRQLAYRNVLRNRRSYAAFLLASVVSVMVFFIYSMFIFHPLFEGAQLQFFALRGMLIAEVVLYIFTLFFLFYSMSAFLQARSKEFGILIQLGMTKKQLNKLIFFETVILGAVSTVTGIVFGYAFTKLFFMIGREIMQLEHLPLYVSWKPFALTVAAFASLFLIISFISVSFIRAKKVLELMKGFWREQEETTASKFLSLLGFVLLGFSYTQAALVTDENVYQMAFIIPPIATLGTYLFFTHSIHSLLSFSKRSRKLYWHKTRLVAIAETSAKLRDSAQMFFIVTIVSTVAFLAVGTLASISSYTGDFRQSNPLGLIYISFEGNEAEDAHIEGLLGELEERKLAYDLVTFEVKRQTSSRTGNIVDILSEGEFNRLARSLSFEAVDLDAGQAMFVPYSVESREQLEGIEVETQLLESGVELEIDDVHPSVMFPIHTLNYNSIVVSTEDFEAVDEPVNGLTLEQSTYTYYAFDVSNWEETSGIGAELSSAIEAAAESGNYSGLNFFFENPGDDYRWFQSSFALLLLIGMMVAVVFLLAAGSFIYFKLYTGLEQDRKQFRLLVHLGMTEKELKKVVNRQLVPQFFLPWALALLHSGFAFVSLQIVWDEFAQLSILDELVIVLACFTALQIFYFFLIRWRYIAHLQAS